MLPLTFFLNLKLVLSLARHLWLRITLPGRPNGIKEPNSNGIKEPNIAATNENPISIENLISFIIIISDDYQISNDIKRFLLLHQDKDVYNLHKIEAYYL